MSGPDGLPRKPPVIFWYTVYRIVILLIDLAVVAAGLFLIAFPDLPFLATPPPAATSSIVQLAGGIYLALASAISLLVAISFCLPRTRTAYAYHLMVMAAGAINGIFCIGFAVLGIASVVALLIYWVRPEVQAYYGWRSEVAGLKK